MSELADFIWPVRVYYEDTDAGGIVYYANYLKFMERARSEYLRCRGLTQNQLAQQQGLLLVVHTVNLRLLRPAKLDDALQVSVGLQRLGGARIELRQRVYRDSDFEVVLCSAEVDIACVDHRSYRPQRLPTNIREAFCLDH